MKALLAITFLISFSAFAGWKQESKAVLKEFGYACPTTEVKIDQIIRNDTIRGHVTGLPTEALDKFKMVFYVKTNHWYIHPYEYSTGQEEGLSFAYLNANGEFKIKTVRRDVPSRKLAAILVPRPYLIQNQSWWFKPLFGIFGGILKYQCNYTVINGTGDFFVGQ